MSRSLCRVVVVWLVFTGALAGAQNAAKSAHRELGISWRAYSNRARTQSQKAQPGQGSGAVVPNPDLSAADSAVEVGKASLPAVPAWSSEAELTERFQSLRDIRFLDDQVHKDFPRRSSWLFPDDGCYARASLAIRNLAHLQVPLPQKIFVFGDLEVQSPNIEGGTVGWWYHVAPIVEVGGEKYILDPAIEPHHPLKLMEWLARMSKDPSHLTVALCATGTYSPYDSCAAATDGKEETAENDQRGFLTQEWDRLVELKRQPELELGEQPPWSVQSANESSLRRF